jgi:Tfp pilus assembly protein PilX
MRRDERGFVLITAMIVLAVFMVLTVAMVTIVDVQANQTGHERSGEAAFELAQSALRAEAYQVQLNWPANASLALPTTCNQSTPQQAGCEGAALTQELQATTGGPDYAHATWQAKVFDDAAGGYSLSPQGTAYDANRDNRMWVWATATTPNGQTRTVVEQVVRQLGTVSLPENVVTAGGLWTQSNGQPVIINAADPASGATGPVDVRCDSAASQPPQGTCLGWQPTQLIPQSAYQGGYVDPTGSSSVLTFAQIQSFVEKAAANGTLYDENATSFTLYDASGTPSGTFTAIQGCPPEPTAGVVVVAGTGACTYNGNVNWNTAAAPGALIFLSSQASLSFSGSETFYGLVYMANQGGATPAAGSVCTPTQLSSAPTLVTVSGSALVTGAVFVDGCGLVSLQDNGDALNFSLNALKMLQTYGSAAPAPGTFRVVSH